MNTTKGTGRTLGLASIACAVAIALAGCSDDGGSDAGLPANDPAGLGGGGPGSNPLATVLGGDVVAPADVAPATVGGAAGDTGGTGGTDTTDTTGTTGDTGSTPIDGTAPDDEPTTLGGSTAAGTQTATSGELTERLQTRIVSGDDFDLWACGSDRPDTFVAYAFLGSEGYYAASDDGETTRGGEMSFVETSANSILVDVEDGTSHDLRSIAFGNGAFTASSSSDGELACRILNSQELDADAADDATDTTAPDGESYEFTCGGDTIIADVGDRITCGGTTYEVVDGGELVEV